MTPLPPVAGVLKVSQVWLDYSDNGAMTVFHLSYTGGPPSAANCASMAAAFNGHAATRFAPLLSEESSVGNTTVLDLSSDLGGEGTAGSETSGTRTGDNIGPAMAMVISKKVARHYRGGHPRSYLPVGTASDVGAGVWDDGLLTASVAAWDNFITDLLSEGVGCSIQAEVSVSYYLDGARRTTPHVDTITSYVAQRLIGSQRRRNRKQ